MTIMAATEFESSGARGRLHAWGDRLCCAALVAAGAAGYAFVAWLVMTTRF